MQDPYNVLGVDRQATEAEIRAAFRRLASRHHPDLHPDDPSAAERFKEINQAQQILSDPDKRAAFDRYGAAAFTPGGMQGAPVEVDLGMDGLFGDLLGAMGFRSPDRGDLRRRLRLTFEEAVLGCTKDVTYERVDACEKCEGSCGEPGTRNTTCVTCGGKGRVRLAQPLLPLALERKCPKCRGTGSVPTQPCTACRGTGLGKRTRTISVKIPAGAESEMSQTVEGGGNRTRNDRKPGDLEIVVEVAQHPFFRRAGDNLVCRVPISFAQAALGGEVEVPTLEGTAKVKVPAATQPGSTLSLKGKGIPRRIRGGRGDQLIEVHVEVPTNLSPRARELVEELGKELGEDYQPQQKSFMERLRSFFG